MLALESASSGHCACVLKKLRRHIMPRHFQSPPQHLLCQRIPRRRQRPDLHPPALAVHEPEPLHQRSAVPLSIRQLPQPRRQNRLRSPPKHHLCDLICSQIPHQPQMPYQLPIPCRQPSPPGTNFLFHLRPRLPITGTTHTCLHSSQRTNCSGPSIQSLGGRGRSSSPAHSGRGWRRRPGRGFLNHCGGGGQSVLTGRVRNRTAVCGRYRFRL